MSDNLDYCRNQIAQARTEIKNLRQQLIALKYEHHKDIKFLKATLNKLSCSSCGDTATTILSHCAEAQSTSTSPINDNSIQFQPIGLIETSFQNKRAVPRQTSILAKAKGTVVFNQKVFSNPEHALEGLQEFSHMWIIFYFHNTESTNVPAKVAPPRLGGERRGVFSTRSPHRPCPIGLSLVKIESIEGNKINFLGVDMISGTPVLDVKPYIPQYDYPNPSLIDALIVRPPAVGSLQINDNGMGRSSSSRIPPPIGSSPPRSPYEHLPSPDAQDIATPVSASPDSPSSINLLDGNSSKTPTRRPDERGAPDGQERFTPPQSAQFVNLTQDGIRVAPWISNPPTQTYQVRFTDDVSIRIDELIGDRALSFKRNVESLLTDDPRSHYVRARYPDHEYSFVLEDLSLSCVFDADLSVCTIVAVRSADELQQS